MTRLPVQSRIEIGADAHVATTRLVRCPDDRRWVSAAGCRHCAKCFAVTGDSLTCNSDARTRESRWPEDAPVAEVLEASVVCVEASAAAESVAALMEKHGAPIAVVLDRVGHPIGVVSRLDVANAPPSRRVETCMTPFVITLLDGATVADAIDAVVERGLTHVPVLADGRVVGIVTPRALLRWLAQRMQTLRDARARPRG